MKMFTRSVPGLWLILLSGSLQAEENAGDHFIDASHSTDHSPHHFSLISAQTHVRGHGEYATLGLEYEYRLNQTFGIGLVVEQTFDGLDATTALAVTNIHLPQGFTLQVGAGADRSHHENIFASRLGVIYEFEIGGFTLYPQMHWNYLQGHNNAVVAGIGFGFSF